MRFSLAIQNRAAIVALFLALGIAISVLLSIAVQPPTSRNDMPGGSYRSEGIFNPRPTLYGLLDPVTAPDGTTYRWSTGHATITFPYEAYLGRYADVEIRLAASRQPGQAPAQVTISLNGVSQPPFTASAGFEKRRFRLDTRQSPNPYLDPAHIQFDIESSTVSSPTVRLAAPDGSADLGVAVDWIELTPQRDTRDVALMAGAWAAGLLLALLVALSRFNLVWAAAYGVGALLSFALVSLTYPIRPFPAAYEVGLVGIAWAVAALLAPSKRPAWGLAVAALCLWVALAGRMFTDWQMDDAYISYRYAWNLTHGQGLVYNPGEAVEGYTNFLWTLLSAAFIGAGFAPGGVMLATVIAFSIGLIGLTFYLGRRLSGGSTLWPLFAMGLLAVDSSFVTYGAKGSGIEAAPFAFLTLLPVALVWWPGVGRGTAQGTAARGTACRAPTSALIAAGVVLALASLTRPEGLAVAALLFGVKLWQERAEGRRVWPALAAMMLPYLLIMLPYELWRTLFYGYPFPNTFYTKTGTSAAILARGWTYTWQFVTGHWYVVLLVISELTLGLVGIVRRIVGERSMQSGIASDSDVPQGAEGEDQPVLEGKWIIRALISLTVFFTLYIIAVGGDHFPEGRFFVPMLGPLVLLAQVVAQRWAGTWTQRVGAETMPDYRLWLRRIAAAGVGIGAVCYLWTALSLQDAQSDLSRRTKRDTNFVNIWGSAGLWLRDHTPPETLGASPVAGAIAFYGQRKVVDMLGITDEHIGHKQVETLGSGLAGHEKEDPAYVLDRQPSYILPYPDYFTPLEERFSSEYITTTVRGPLGPDIIWWQRQSGAGR